MKKKNNLLSFRSTSTKNNDIEETKDRFSQAETDDQTLSHLVNHMHQLRDAVPVNHDLKANLKKQLINKLKQQQLNQQEISTTYTKGKTSTKRRWIMTAAIVAVLTIAFCSFLVLSTDELAVADYRTHSFPTVANDEGHVVQPNSDDLEQVNIGISSDGLSMGLTYDGRLYVSHVENIWKPFFEEMSEGVFVQPTFANKEPYMAIVYEINGDSQVWLVTLGNSVGARLIFSQQDTTVDSMFWSEDDQYLLLKLDGSNEEIIVRTDGAITTIDESQLGTEWPKKEKPLDLSHINLPRDIQRVVNESGLYLMDWTTQQNKVMLYVTNDNEPIIYLIRLKDSK